VSLIIDFDRPNLEASSASDALASCLAMITVLPEGVKQGFFLAFPLISVLNERRGGILWWVENEVDAHAIFVFALAFGYFWLVLYVNILYTTEVATKGHEEWERLCRVYFLAEKLQDVVMENRLTDAIC
jgi:hypothetical protein